MLTAKNVKYLDIWHYCTLETLTIRPSIIEEIKRQKVRKVVPRTWIDVLVVLDAFLRENRVITTYKVAVVRRSKLGSLISREKKQHCSLLAVCALYRPGWSSWWSGLNRPFLFPNDVTNKLKDGKSTTCFDKPPAARGNDPNYQCHWARNIPSSGPSVNILRWYPSFHGCKCSHSYEI